MAAVQEEITVAAGTVGADVRAVATTTEVTEDAEEDTEEGGEEEDTAEEVRPNPCWLSKPIFNYQKHYSHAR